MKYWNINFISVDNLLYLQGDNLIKKGFIYYIHNSLFCEYNHTKLNYRDDDVGATARKRTFTFIPDDICSFISSPLSHRLGSLRPWRPCAPHSKGSPVHQTQTRAQTEKHHIHNRALQMPGGTVAITCLISKDSSRSITGYVRFKFKR